MSGSSRSVTVCFRMIWFTFTDMGVPFSSEKVYSGNHRMFPAPSTLICGLHSTCFWFRLQAYVLDLNKYRIWSCSVRFLLQWSFYAAAVCLYVICSKSGLLAGCGKHHCWGEGKLGQARIGGRLLVDISYLLAAGIFHFPRVLREISSYVICSL